jgi:molybdate transport system substrate-binding protein
MRPKRSKASIFFVIVSCALMGTSLATIHPLRAEEQSVVRVLAAGSLRAAMIELGTAFADAGAVKVESNFGPSGVLRERIEKGEAADLFASADMGNPLTLQRAGKSGPVVLFARNRLCALARPGLALTPDTLLAALLDPQIKVGTSTPKRDPAGDYTWAMFAKAESVHPGSRALLEGKAIQLIGGADSAVPPPGVDVFAWHLREGRADIFIEYCSARATSMKDLPNATVVNLPPVLATGADYGLTLLPTKNADAAAFALFILSQQGQKILAQNGFEAPLAARE